MNKIKIGVTGTGSLIGQAIIKSIRASSFSEKLMIVGFDYFSNTVGSFWCDQNYLLPDVLKLENKEKWKAMILEVINTEKLSILFIGVDFELLLFARLRREIEISTGCKVVVSSEQVINIGNDKYLTQEFLKENGLNYPKTWLPAEISNSEFEYPCILKPRVGARSKGVSVIKNKEDMDKKSQLVKEPIVQELIGDDSREFTCGVLCFDNKVIGSIALNRYLKEGNTCLAEYNKNYDGRIYDYLEKIALKLNPHGSCNMQLRLNTDGEPFLFEINPRFSGTTYIRSLFGFKEVEYTIRYLLNMKTIPFQLREGKAYRYYEEKLLESNK